MLAQRLLTAAVGIPIIVGVIYVGGILFTAVVSVILAIAAIEFVQIFRRRSEFGEPGGWFGYARREDVEEETRRLRVPGPAAVIAGAACAAMPVIVDIGDFEWPPELSMLVGLAMVYILVRGVPDFALPSWATILAAVAYVGLLGSYFVLLRDLDDDGHWVFWAVLSTWGTDTAAYSVGKLVGRHKMAPSISPGKTWEGTIGALVGGFVVVAALGWALPLPVSVGQAALLGLMLPAVAVLADLGESVLKRSAGVKDTSELVPGHGGFLDRLDSLLFTAPLVYLFAVWVVE